MKYFYDLSNEQNIKELIIKYFNPKTSPIAVECMSCPVWRQMCHFEFEMMLHLWCGVRSAFDVQWRDFPRYTEEKDDKIIQASQQISLLHFCVKEDQIYCSLVGWDVNMVNVFDLKPSNCPNETLNTSSSSEDELRDMYVSHTSVADSLGRKRRKIESLGSLGTEPKKRRIRSFQTETKKRMIWRLQSKLRKPHLGDWKIHSDLSDEASNSLSQDEVFHDAVTLDEDLESCYYSTPETRNIHGKYNLKHAYLYTCMKC